MASGRFPMPPGGVKGNLAEPGRFDAQNKAENPKALPQAGGMPAVLVLRRSITTYRERRLFCFEEQRIGTVRFAS
jgi:hypothetical protein